MTCFPRPDGEPYPIQDFAGNLHATVRDEREVWVYRVFVDPDDPTYVGVRALNKDQADNIAFKVSPVGHATERLRPLRRLFGVTLKELWTEEDIPEWRR